MKIKVMYRAQCLAAALGYGPEYDAENIDEPTLIISISSTDDKLPLIMNEADNENIPGMSNTSSSMTLTLPKACMGSNRCLTRTPDVL